MNLVVDASVAVKWFVEEEDTKRACLLADGAVEIHCPHLLASEVGSALWRKVLQGQVELGDARTGMQSLARMPITWHADEALGERLPSGWRSPMTAPCTTPCTLHWHIA